VSGIDYVICAAGDGTRMKEISGGLPKPLIKLAGLTLLERSLDSLDFQKEDRLILITQKAHAIRERAQSLIPSRYPALSETIWLELEHVTSGQLATALQARPHFEPDRPIVIFNSDTYFRSSSLALRLADPTVEGIIPCARVPGSQWSFCEVGPDGWVKRVEEKVRISELASVGYYFFRDPVTFLQDADQELREPAGARKEHYVAPLYNRMIARGQRVAADVVDLFKPMGSVDQLREYWSGEFTQ
jgi:NDP-sugar pyrophosphorylase family protein